MPDLKVAIAGAGGRMGGANLRAVLGTPGLKLHSAFDRIGAPAIGKDAGGPPRDGRHPRIPEEVCDICRGGTVSSVERGSRSFDGAAPGPVR